MISEAPIHLSNSLSGRREVFAPAEPGKIKMYVCGITPYDECHLGHARCYILFDIVKRFFKASGYSVRHVQNFTDIDDKIIQRAQTLGEDPSAVSERFIADYHDKMGQLNVLPADAYPKVTETIPQVVAFIEKLIQKDFAYAAGGDVFFAVRKFKTYGNLSKRSLDELESGARVEINDQKKDPLDFALWKAAKPGEPSWPSPWGAGRPGWHIECSVMSIQHLGESFDIHGGGQDLIFPHHENEIAQSEAATGKPFAKYWIHNGFVTVNREKMSKSLGNFFTLKDVFRKFSPEVVRFFLLSRHYKSPLDFSDDLLIQSQSAYHGLQEVYSKAYFVLDGDAAGGSLLEDWKAKALEAMADDFNSEKVIAILFDLNANMVSLINARKSAELKDALRTAGWICAELLGVPLRSAFTPDAIRGFKKDLEKRDESRRNKDWAAADQIRNDFEKLGYAIEDTPLGPVLKPKRS